MTDFVFEPYQPLVQQPETDASWLALVSEYQARSAERESTKCKSEPYLGADPQMAELVTYVNKVINDYHGGTTVKSKADQALFWHIMALLNRSYSRKHDNQPLAEALCDRVFRRNKQVSGKQPMFHSSPTRLMDMGLLAVSRPHCLLKGQSTIYTLHPQLRAFHNNLELTSETVMVNPLTGKQYRKPRNQMKDAPADLQYIADRASNGILIDLNAVYAHHNIQKQAVAHLFSKAHQSLTPAELSDLARYEANAHALRGIIINRPSRKGALAYVTQAWGYTFCGRLKPLHSGYINLSKEYKAVGLASVGEALQPRWEYDLCAAQVNVLLGAVQNNNQTLLKQYAANRDLRVKWAEEIGVPVSAVKKALISLLFGCSVPSVKQAAAIENYSFATAFGEQYPKALQVLGAFINEVTQSIDQLVSTAPQVKTKHGITFTNSLGMQYSVNEINPESRRKVAAFLLQAGEQKAISRILKANPDAQLNSYEYDGFTSAQPIEWIPVDNIYLELKNTNVTPKCSTMELINTNEPTMPNQPIASNYPELKAGDTFRNIHKVTRMFGEYGILPALNKMAAQLVELGYEPADIHNYTESILGAMYRGKLQQMLPVTPMDTIKRASQQLVKAATDLGGDLDNRVTPETLTESTVNPGDLVNQPSAAPTNLQTTQTLTQPTVKGADLTNHPTGTNPDMQTKRYQAIVTKLEQAAAALQVTPADIINACTQPNPPANLTQAVDYFKPVMESYPNEWKGATSKFIRGRELPSWTGSSILERLRLREQIKANAPARIASKAC